MTPRPSTGSVRKLSLPLLGAALGNAVQARRLAVWIHGHPLPVFALSLHPSGQAGNGKERLAGRKDGHLHACVHETRHKRGSVLNTTGRSREGQSQPALDDGRCGGLGVPGRPRHPPTLRGGPSGQALAQVDAGYGSQPLGGAGPTDNPRLHVSNPAGLT